MKFSDVSGLKEFLRQTVSGYCDLREIYTGGSSYNFKLTTKSGDYLLKLTDKAEKYHKLKAVCSALYDIQCPIEQKFDQYYLLIMPYIEGKSLRYGVVNADLMHRLADAFRRLAQSDLPAQYILPQQSLAQLYQQVENIIARSDNRMERFVLEFLMNKMQKDRSDFKPVKQIIHGDFSANNIMVDQTGMPHILDFEAVRYGSSVEDVAFLMLQLSGFRGMLGSLRKFMFLKKLVEAEHAYTREEWIYGVQFVYLNRICRRYGGQKKHTKQRNIRKNICFLLSILEYVRLRRVL